MRSALAVSDFVSSAASVIVVGDGVHLSPLSDNDKAALVRHLADPRVARATLRVAHPYTIADAHQWITLARARRRSFGRDLVWAIRESSGELAGCAGFEIEDPGAHKAELGYWLGTTYWGRGWMTLVVRALVGIGWQYGWTRISASVFDSNLASARVLEKAGFHHEATLKKYYYKAGVYADALIYAQVR